MSHWLRSDLHQQQCLKSLAQRAPIHLAGGSKRQFGNEIEYLRNLVTAQLLLLPEESVESFDRRREVARDDEGLDTLAEFAVGASDDGAMPNLRMTTERGLDLFCMYLDPARIDDVVNTAIDPEVAIGINVAEVSASPPSPYELLSREIGVAPVSHRHRRTGNGDFTSFSDRHLVIEVAIGINNLQVGAERWQAGGAGLIVNDNVFGPDDDRRGRTGLARHIGSDDTIAYNRSQPLDERCGR